jgi:hypothetical protein
MVLGPTELTLLVLVKTLLVLVKQKRGARLAAGRPVSSF